MFHIRKDYKSKNLKKKTNLPRSNKLKHCSTKIKIKKNSDSINEDKGYEYDRYSDWNFGYNRPATDIIIRIREHDRKTKITKVDSLNHSKLLDLIEKKNYVAIIKDKKLFWMLYCSLQRSKNIICEEYVLKNDIFPSLGIDEGVLKLVEYIRLQIVNNLHLRKNTFIYKSSKVDPYLDKFYGENKPKPESFFFSGYILPFLKPLAESVGFEYFNVNISPSIHGKIRNRIVFINRLENILISPIQPLKVPTKEINDTIVIKVDSELLETRSGPVIKSMIESEFIESTKKCVHFADFDISIVQFYINFLQFGNKILRKKVELLQDLNFFDLIRFAHLYNEKNLFNFCVNIFGYFSEDFEILDILEISNLYQNDQLKKIYEKTIELKFYNLEL